MLAEVLADRGDWSQVMPGVRACLFSLEKSPLHLPLRLEPLHFEALFCVAGTVTLTRRDGSALTAGARQVLLLTDASSLSAAKAGTSLEGVLVAVDARSARDSLETLCALLGGLSLDTCLLYTSPFGIWKDTWSRATKSSNFLTTFRNSI